MATPQELSLELITTMRDSDRLQILALPDVELDVAELLGPVDAEMGETP